MDLFVTIVTASVLAMTPFLIAGLGELVCEKSGVLNLGVEGMMLMGSVSGFIVASNTNSLFLGFITSIVAGTLFSLLFAVLTLFLRANQVASGLALSIFGVGLSAFMGLTYTGTPLDGLEELYMPFLSDIPIVGKLFFSYDPIVYLGVLGLFAVSYFLYHTKSGLVLRGVGENHDAARAIGYSVLKVRFFAVLFGGAMAGLAGGYLSLAYTPLWTQNMVAGKGWIVLALVVFATWNPTRLFAGAFLFGLISISQLFLQSNDGWLSFVPIEFFSMLPYIVTIVVLSVISSVKFKQTLQAPKNLGKIFEPK